MVLLGYSGQAQVTANAGGSLAPVHYRIDIPADAERLSFMVNDLGLRRGDYTIHWHSDGPVRFVQSRRPPVIAEGSLAPGDALTRTSDPPIPRCKTLYMTIRTDNLSEVQQAIYEVSAQLSRSGIEETCDDLDAGVGDTDAAVPVDGGPEREPAGGGCGCRAAPSSGRGLALIFFAAALLFVSRRV